MRKQVLFVIYSIYGGGAEKQMQYILRYLDRDKFIPHLAVFRIWGRERNLVPSDVEIYNLRKNLHFAPLVIPWRLMMLIKRIKPDVILSFMWPANLVSLLIGWILRREVMISERTYPSINVREYSLAFLWKRLIAFLYRKARLIISVSERVKRDLCENFFLPEKKIVVVKNGIDISKVRKKMEEYEPPFEGYIFACGNLRREKNYDFLIEVVANISGILLVIAGGGREEEKDRLGRKAKELGVNLILPGFQENPYPWFKKAKVLVLTSNYEGSPNVVLEAFACGVPVVAIDCPGGIRELIKDGENGFLIPPQNKNAMVEAIKRILHNPSLVERLKKNAHLKIAEYDIRRMVGSYERLIMRCD